MNETGLSYIDLFAGAGGLSEGFIQSGYQPIAHVEMNEYAAKTIETRIAYYHLKEKGQLDSYYQYEKGLITREELLKLIPEQELKTVINKEMSEATIKSIFETIDTIKLEKGIEQVDVIIGGPPCQAYSLVGRAQSSHMLIPMEDDPRNELYKMYVQFLKKYKPRMFVFENVAGIKTARGGQAFKNLQMYMKRVGYELDYHELNAKDFGVLQSRKRVIIVGWLKGTGYEYPTFEIIEEIQQLDTKDYMEELSLYQDILNKDTCNNFKVIMWEQVPYVVPIATQTLIALPKDAEGIEINNIYDMNSDVRMQNIHIGVFPLSGYSIVYAFYHRRDKLYRRLHHQMNSMSLEKKLGLINYWIFKYTENYYMSPDIQNVLDADDKLKELSRDNNGNPNLGYITTMDLLFPREEIKPEDVTNILMEDCAIRK